MTRCDGDSALFTSWTRLIVPICPRCNALIRATGDAGRVEKATGARWFPGHGHGIYEQTYIPKAWDEP